MTLAAASAANRLPAPSNVMPQGVTNGLPFASVMLPTNGGGSAADAPAALDISTPSRATSAAADRTTFRKADKARPPLDAYDLWDRFCRFSIRTAAQPKRSWRCDPESYIFSVEGRMVNDRL